MEAQKPPLSDAEKARWFSTGYLAHGVGQVNADQHALADAAVIRCGEAKGHDMWIDSQFCADVARIAGETADKGVKARFGHPDMCSDALGTFLGRWKGLSTGADGVVRGTLHLSSTAAESPKGDLRNYVEQMAAKEPDHFGTSIVFSRDWEAEEAFTSANVKEFDEYDETGKPTGNKVRRFQSPDPANVKNLRHARLSALHAADLVDDPAATDGMFSGAGGAALAANVSEWLDTHPEVLSAFADNPEMVSILERYATQLRPFIARYNANHPVPSAEPDAPAVRPDTPPPAEPDAALKAQVETLTTQLSESAAKLASAEASVVALTTERDTARTALDASKAEVEKLRIEKDTADKARTEAEARLTAILSGQSPVSAAPAEPKTGGTMWDDARKSRKK